jgi:hypothetical protein
MRALAHQSTEEGLVATAEFHCAASLLSVDHEWILSTNFGCNIHTQLNQGQYFSYASAGFELTTATTSSNLIGGRRRRCHITTPPEGSFLKDG